MKSCDGRIKFRLQHKGENSQIQCEIRKIKIAWDENIENTCKEYKGKDVECRRVALLLSSAIA